MDNSTLESARRSFEEIRRSHLADSRRAEIEAHQRDHFMLKVLRTRRMILAVGVGTFGILTVVGYVLYSMGYIANTATWFALGAGALGAFASAFFKYLDVKDDFRSPDISEYRLERLESQLQYREEELNKALSNIQIGDEDKENLLAEAKRAILASARDNVLDEIRTTISRDAFEEMFVSCLARIPQRLEKEIGALRRRSNINLFFGIVLGLCGLSMLWTVAFRESGHCNRTNQLADGLAAADLARATYRTFGVLFS